MFARSRNDPDGTDLGFAGGSADDVDAAPAPSSRSPRGDLTGGRERTIHFQPEDRYWTDYLRIALPVIGLVLMLGVFWYWAAALIGDNGGDEPIATNPPGQAELNNPPASSPAAEDEQSGDNQANADVSTADQTATAAAAAEGEQGASTEQTPAPEEEGGDNQAADQEVADQQAGEIAVDAQVEITEDGVNLRPGPNTDQDPTTTLDQGTVLTVTGGPEAGEDFDWWQVRTEDGETGWVAGTFLQPVD